MEASPFSPNDLITSNFSGRPPHQIRKRLLKLRATARPESSDLSWGISKAKMAGDGTTTTALRRKLREARAMDRADCPLSLPEHWTDWEKEYNYVVYESQALEILWQLQIGLLTGGGGSSSDGEAQPPSLAIEFTVMVTMSLPAPVRVVVMHLMDATKAAMSVMSCAAEEESRNTTASSD